MNTVSSWGNTIVSSFQDLWTRFINFLPAIIGAILVFVIGGIIATLVGKLVARVLKKLWLDKASKKANLSEFFAKAGLEIDIADTIGLLIKWFLILVFLMAATDILGMTQITSYLNRVLLYVPNVVIAVIILLLGLLFANFAQVIIRGSVKIAKLGSAPLLAGIAKWVIIVFSIIAALIQLDVASELLSFLFKGVIAMIAIAGGLAFGLGGKEQASKILEKTKTEFFTNHSKKE